VRKPMRAKSLALISSVLFAAGCANTTTDTREVGAVSEALVGDALPGLSSAQLQAFQDGKAAFAEVESLADGLGPLFNEKSCGHCHSVGAVGGSGTQYEVRAGQLLNGVFDPLASQGGSLFALFSVGNLTGNERNQVPNCTLAKNGEPLPAQVNVTDKRRTTALFGLGLVDNTPESAFTAIINQQPSSIRGHANQVFNIAANTTTMGKFGWKAQVPTLHQFSGDAYVNEMGITNPEFPNEQPPLGNPSLVAACDLVPGLEDDGTDVDEFTNFMRMLAPVAPTSESSQAAAGDALFQTIGCDGCHVRTLISGTGSDIAALNNQTYHPFSDFLLHNMGSLGDGIGDSGMAGLNEMRTAPLWGLRLADPKHQLLHDGRATSLADAILRHDGQAVTARNNFAALSSSGQDNVLAFLKTL
jgi:CxxC motif-containing protein (DUF1111 family)